MSVRFALKVAHIAIASAMFSMCVQPANAANVQYSGLAIAKVRAVGDYQGATYDNTLEVWPVNPLAASSNCTSTFRFYIDSKNKHLIAAVYLALSTGKKIDVNLDDSLPIRDGACEASFLDLSGQ